jgi:hypothetical protein
MLPGFTASYSLFRTKHLYRGGRSSSGQADALLSGSVVPQTKCPPGCHPIYDLPGQCVCPVQLPCPSGSHYSVVSNQCVCDACAWNEISTGFIPPNCCKLLTCESGKTPCYGNCVDTKSDPNNCGGCRRACGSGQTCCNGFCTDISTDNNNCGACGSICQTENCCGGQCCDEGYGTCCNGQCCPDPYFCCGTTCCSNGDLGNPPQACCNGTCQLQDNQHCGFSCESCTGGTTCQLDPSQDYYAYACLCPTGQTWCASTNQCADTSSDPNNCGSCGNMCAPGEICKNSICMCGKHAACAAGETCTNGKCMCGTGKACSGGKVCCSGSCVDTSTSPKNCGSCGFGCSSGENCQGGTCLCGSGPACVSPEVCKNNICMCGSNPACTGGQTCCSGNCVELLTDTKNCGVCGNACEKGKTCQAGLCGCPDITPDYCTSAQACVNFQTDSNNCGGCGNKCPSNSSCMNGVCYCNTAGQRLCNSMTGQPCQPGGPYENCKCVNAMGANCGACSPPCGAGESCGTCTASMVQTYSTTCSCS